MNENLRLKHLEMIQSVINRLASNSFLIKGWSISVITAGFGLYFTTKEYLLLNAVLFASLMFWYLDAFYLKEERIFRAIYEHNALIKTIKKEFTFIDLRMHRKKFEKKVQNIFITMLTSDCLLQYVVAILMIEVFFINYLLRR